MCPKIHNVALCFGGGHSLGTKATSEVLPWDQCDGRAQSVCGSSPTPPPPLCTASGGGSACPRLHILGKRHLHSGLSSVVFPLLAGCRESPETRWKLPCHEDGPCLRSSKWISNCYEDVVHVSVWGRWCAFAIVFP